MPRPQTARSRARLQGCGVYVSYGDFSDPCEMYRQEPPPAWLEALLGKDFFLCPTRVGYAGEKSEVIDDRVFENLKGLNGLLEIDFHHCDVGDRGLESLAALDSLVVVKVCSSRITDAGLAHLKGLRNLRCLDITSSEVTMAGLVAHLKNAGQLHSIWLLDRHLTNEERRILREGLPGMDITTDIPLPALISE